MAIIIQVRFHGRRWRAANLLPASLWPYQARLSVSGSRPCRRNTCVKQQVNAGEGRQKQSSETCPSSRLELLKKTRAILYDE